MRTNKKLAVENLERREVFTGMMPGVEGFVDVSDPENPVVRDADDLRSSGMPPTVVQGDIGQFDRGFLPPTITNDFDGVKTPATSHSLKHPVDATGMPIGECVAAVEQVLAVRSRQQAGAYRRRHESVVDLHHHVRDTRLCNVALIVP